MITDKQLAKLDDLLNEKINDEPLKLLVREFILNFLLFQYEDNKNFILAARALVKSFKKIRIYDICWDTLCNQIRSHSLGRYQQHIVVQCYLFILQHDMWFDEYKEYLKENHWIFKELKGKWVERFYKGSIPYNLRQVMGQKGYEIIDLRCKSEFIRNLLIQYLSYECSKCKFGHRFRIFLKYFEDSLMVVDELPNRIEDFTIKTFKIQYRFYKKIKWADNHKATRHIKGFYVFLADEMLKDEQIYKLFPSDCGIDKYYLEHDHFDTLYEKGYKVVYFNMFDNIPQINRWVLAPNGQEKRTIVKNGTEYKPFNFLRVKNQKFREALKRWFIKSSNNIYTKEKMINCIFKFFEFIESDEYIEYANEDLISILYLAHQKKSKNRAIDDISITVEMIVAYRIYLNSYYDNSPTINNNISSVKNFLDYVYNEKLFKVEYEVFDCMRLGDKGTYRGKPLLKEDAELIVNKFKQVSSQGDSLAKLLWIIVNISLTTNLRISEILGLQRNCIVETMKKGQYAVKLKENESISDNNLIKLKRKFSNGKAVEYNPTPYLIRQIEIAKDLTEDLISEADAKISNFIFLKRSKIGQVTTISKEYFYGQFKAMINSLTLIGGPYTVYNLRDTFMTGIYYKAINEGLDLFYTHAATGHKSIVTTVKHYINYDIRYYLEATYKVKIGDIDIKGKVVKTLDEEIENIPINVNNILVKDGCGYCNNGTCYVDCLLCSSIVVTLDRIPYFEKAINNIQHQIDNEEIQHEKEHLVAIKRLYVAFLEKLFILKEEVNTNE